MRLTTPHFKTYTPMNPQMGANAFVVYTVWVDRKMMTVLVGIWQRFQPLAYTVTPERIYSNWQTTQTTRLLLLMKPDKECLNKFYEQINTDSKLKKQVRSSAISVSTLKRHIEFWGIFTSE